MDSLLNPALKASPLPLHLVPFLRHTRRVVLFGAGLDTGGEGLLSQCFYGAGSPFQLTGLFPGAEGKHADNCIVHLIDLWCRESIKKCANMKERQVFVCVCVCVNVCDYDCG